MKVLRDEGAAALTVRAVAAAAGCSTTGVYTWFGGKNGLVEAIFLNGFRRFGRAIGAAAETESMTALEQIGEMARAYRMWALANPTHYSVMFGHAVEDFEPSDEALSVALETFATLVEAIDQLDPPGDPVELATFAWATLHGFVSIEIAGMTVAHADEERQAAFDAGVRRVLDVLRAG